MTGLNPDNWRPTPSAPPVITTTHEVNGTTGRSNPGGTTRIEARERAAVFASRGALSPPPDASERYRRFVERQPGSGSEYYPGGCQARPEDAWGFTVFGEFLNSLPFDRARKDFTNGLRTLRNALAHGHYMSWAVLGALRKLEREAAGV